MKDEPIDIMKIRQLAFEEASEVILNHAKFMEDLALFSQLEEQPSKLEKQIIALLRSIAYEVKNLSKNKNEYSNLGNLPIPSRN